MSETHPHPADRALCVLPAAVSKRSKGLPDVERLRNNPTNGFLKEFSREGRTFRKLMRVGCYIQDPLAELLYGHSQPRHSHHLGATCRETDIIPSCPKTLPSCCHQHRQEVAEVVRQHRRLLYHSPRPVPDVAMRIPDRLERVVSKNAHDNQRHKFPITTVKVRWHESASVSGVGYDESVIRDIMETYGPIKAVEKCDATGACVVFENLADSCLAMERRVVTYYLGFESYRLNLSWYHRSMQAKTFRKAGKGIKGFTDPFAMPCCEVL